MEPEANKPAYTVGHGRFSGYCRQHGIEAAELTDPSPFVHAAEVARLQGLLGRLEWAGHDGAAPSCPACDRWQRDGHGPGCKIAEVLGR